MFMASLNSGSNGNCYYVGNESDAVLVDAGISCREVLKRLDRLGIALKTIRAIIISHEHSDHIRGVSILAKKLSIPVYISPQTKSCCLADLCDEQVQYFQSENPFRIGALSVTPFPKYHDAADPYSFVIDSDGERVGVFTDIGAPCPRLIKYFSTCDSAFLEANYDDEMLSNGAYPYHLKKRIRGGKGHLSNTEALDLFKKHRSTTLSHLILSHLSANNNCPILVNNLFQRYASQTTVVVASRTAETALYPVKAVVAKAIIPRPASTQMSLQFL